MHENTQGTVVDGLSPILDIIEAEEQALGNSFPFLKEYLQKPLDSLLSTYVEKRDILVSHFSERFGAKKEEAVMMASDVETSPRDLNNLAEHPMIEVRKLVIQNPNTSLRTLERMRRSPHNHGVMSTLDVIAHPSSDNAYKENFIRHANFISSSEIKWLISADKVYASGEDHVRAEQRDKLTFSSIEMLLTSDYDASSFAPVLGPMEYARSQHQAEANFDEIKELLESKLSLYRENTFPLEFLREKLESGSPFDIYAAGISSECPDGMKTEAHVLLVNMGEDTLATKLKNELNSNAPVKIEINDITHDKTTNIKR